MPSQLLDLCRQHGLKAPRDYRWTPLGPYLTEAGEAKLNALMAADPALAEAMLAATGEAVAAVLAGHPRLPRRLRRAGERMLAQGDVAR